MNESPKFRLGLRDLLRGLIIAVLTPVAFIAQQSIDAGTLHIEPKTALFAGLAGGVGYLIKNFFTNNTQSQKS